MGSKTNSDTSKILPDFSGTREEFEKAFAREVKKTTKMRALKRGPIEDLAVMIGQAAEDVFHDRGEAIPKNISVAIEEIEKQLENISKERLDANKRASPIQEDIKKNGYTPRNMAMALDTVISDNLKFGRSLISLIGLISEMSAIIPDFDAESFNKETSHMVAGLINLMKEDQDTHCMSGKRHEKEALRPIVQKSSPEDLWQWLKKKFPSL